MERCRFCYVEKNKDSYKDIFNNRPVNISIAKIAEQLTGLTITETDPYTKQSCLNCFNMLIYFYHYRETILRTYQLLIENEISNKNCNNNQGNFERDNYGQSILTDDGFTHFSDSLHLGGESDDDHQRTYENNQQSNTVIDNDNETTIDDNKNNCNNNNNGNDNNDKQRLGKKNSLCADRDNQQSFDFIKVEMDIAETRFKIENDFNDADQVIYENNHHPSILVGDIKNETFINSNNEISDNDSDRYCSDMEEDKISIKEFPSIIDIDSNNDQDIVKDKSEEHYQCNICTKKFTTKGNLKQHLLTHTGERPYQCNICEKNFIRRTHLKRHLFTHNGERPYQCDICKRAFSIKSNLTAHLKEHNSEKAHQCNICKKQFSYKSVLATHLKRLKGEKPHLCNFCDKKFTTKADLKRHALIHSAAH